MPYIKVATLKEVIQLSDNLREEDVDEIKAHSNTTPFFALKLGTEFSHLPLAIMNDEDKPIFIIGVIPQEKNVGMIWLLSSPEIEKISITFLRNCKGVLDLLNNTFPILYNYVDARNTVHIKWLKWLGFQFIKVHENFGYEQRKFIEFFKYV